VDRSDSLGFILDPRITFTGHTAYNESGSRGLGQNYVRVTLTVGLGIGLVPSQPGSSR
jgi:hypothetical protein